MDDLRQAALAALHASLEAYLRWQAAEAERLGLGEGGDVRTFLDRLGAG